MPSVSRASNSLPNASDVLTDPAVPGESPRCRGRAPTFPRRRGPSPLGAFEGFARRGRGAERVFGGHVSSDTFRRIPAGIRVQLASMPPVGGPVLWATGCLPGAHPGRDLLREVPISIRRQGASRSVQPGSSDAADDSAGRSSRDLLTLQTTPSPFTGARRAAGRDGAVAEHSPTGIVSVVILSLFPSSNLSIRHWSAHASQRGCSCTQ